MTEDRVVKMLHALGRRLAAEPVPERDPEALKAAVRRRVEALTAGPIEPRRPVMLVAASEGSPAPAAAGTPVPLRRVTRGPGADRWKGPSWDTLNIRVELLTGGEPSLRLTSRPEDWQVAAECITEPDQLPVDHPSELGPRQSADTVALDWPTDDHVDRIALHVERGEGAEYLGCVLLEQHSPAGEAVPSS